MRRALIVIVVGVVTLLGYVAGQKRNPPGFYVDESSIAYNALTIARYGCDEWGVRWPLYFRAFGEYKNPVYIYLLAGVFRVTHPSNLAARRFSALLGYLAAVSIALIAFMISQRGWIGWTVFLLALTTPQLFETSRLVFEVALFPLAIALYLFCAWKAANRERWSAWLIASLAASLVLITYTYSTGRMLGLAFALALFILVDRRERAIGAAIVLAAYVAVGLVPMLIFNATHAGALTQRTDESSLLREHGDPTRKIATFEQQYVGNLLPLGMALSGDPNPRHHVPGSLGAIDLGVLLLDAVSLFFIFRRRPWSRWWIFIVVLIAISAVPASLFDARYHALRLIPIPILLLLLAIPALQSGSRRLTIAALLLCVLQTSWFFSMFARYGAARTNVFDADFPRVLRAALAQPVRPIYLRTSYVHANWYATLAGVPLSNFTTNDPAPARHAVIGSNHDVRCDGCQVIVRGEDFTAWVTPE
ncbi:MAG TPA: glycosyltransferase family 39 protein [Thermoanaerobaculia bacterium]|nr:glycosyltransferase family 39 protein [Thermoanaerobaculia bacterium]